MRSRTRSSPVRWTTPEVIPGPIAAAAKRSPAATGADTPPTRPDAPGTYRCPTCEHVLRVVGVDRHRVFFELTDQQLDDPVMNRVCPGCGHGLPGKNPSGLPGAFG